MKNGDTLALKRPKKEKKAPYGIANPKRMPTFAPA